MGKQSRRRQINHKDKNEMVYLRGKNEGYLEGHAAGWAAGVEHASRQIDNYMIPAEWAIADLNTVTAYVAGVLSGGFGELPRRQLSDAHRHLGVCMSEIRTLHARARGEGKLDLETPDLSKAQRLYEAIEHYLETASDNGDALRNLIGQMSTNFINRNFTLRPKFGPGSPEAKENKGKQLPHNLENNKRIHAYVQQGCTLSIAIEKTLQDWISSGDRGTLAQNAMKALESDAARQSYQRWQKRSSLMVLEG